MVCRVASGLFAVMALFAFMCGLFAYGLKMTAIAGLSAALAVVWKQKPEPRYEK